MNTPPPSNNSAQETVMLVYMMFIAALAWLFWHFFHVQITNLCRIACYGELWLLSRVVSDPVIPQLRDIMHDPQHYAIDWPYVRYASGIVGHYFRWPAAAVMVIMAYYMGASTPRTSFKKSYTLDRLIAAQSKVWPVIAPIVNFNPAQDNARDINGGTPDKLPLFAEALSPEEWLKYNKISHGANGLNRDAAADVFAEQLGPRWKGPEALPFHIKGLFAAFALKINRNRDEADALLGELSLAADPKMGMALRPSAALRRKVDSIVKDPKIGGVAAKLADDHAYVASAMLRILDNARESGGVLAPAQFLWLRGANRSLWYALNNLGRQSFHVEAAGAISHYFAEKRAKSPLLRPKVANAVSSLSAYDQRPGQTMLALK